MDLFQLLHSLLSLTSCTITLWPLSYTRFDCRGRLGMRQSFRCLKSHQWLHTTLVVNVENLVMKAWRCMNPVYDANVRRILVSMVDGFAVEGWVTVIPVQLSDLVWSSRPPVLSSHCVVDVCCTSHDACYVLLPCIFLYFLLHNITGFSFCWFWRFNASNEWDDNWCGWICFVPDLQSCAFFLSSFPTLHTSCANILSYLKLKQRLYAVVSPFH